jgi:hypothetical protein
MTNNDLITLVLQAAKNAEVEIFEVGELSISYFGFKIRLNGEVSGTSFGSKKDFENYEFVYAAILKEKQLLTEITAK